MSEDLPSFEGIERNFILNDGRTNFLRLIAYATPQEAWDDIRRMDRHALEFIVIERLWTLKTMGGPVHEGDWNIDWPDVD